MPSQSNPLESSYGSYNRMTVFEGLSVKLTPAPLLKRILAYVIDFSIVMMVLYLLFYLLLFGFFFSMASLSSVFSSASEDIFVFITLFFLLLLFIAIYDGYFIYFEFKTGSTPGKKVFGLRVVPTNKPKLTLSQCIFRDLFRLVDCILILPGLISIAVTKSHQRLGDLVAGTMVTYSQRKEAQSQFVYLTAEQYHLFHETLKPQAISQEHREAFLQFAFAEFISGKNPTLSPEEIAEWETFVLHYVPEAKKHSLDPNTLFLFFAEHCLQISKQKS